MNALLLGLLLLFVMITVSVSKHYLVETRERSPKAAVDYAASVEYNEALWMK